MIRRANQAVFPTPCPLLIATLSFFAKRPEALLCHFSGKSSGQISRSNKSGSSYQDSRTFNSSGFNCTPLPHVVPHVNFTIILVPVQTALVNHRRYGLVNHHTVLVYPRLTLPIKLPAPYTRYLLGHIKKILDGEVGGA